MEKGWTKDAIDELPYYWACCQVGAFGPDHLRLRLGETDRAMYLMAKAKKERNNG